MVNALEECLHRREGVLAQEAQGQTVLLRMDDGSYYALDDVGALVWDLCDGERSLGEIVATLCSTYDASEETITADVLDFVNDLRRERLLLVVAP